ncbi:hypothetical protein JW777_06635 [bacterium]|nr:hypothetical protein [bacterium]
MKRCPAVKAAVSGMSALLLLLSTGCGESTEPSKEDRSRTRLESLPDDAVKMSPADDPYPPILHAAEWNPPVPLDSTVNTAGAEDSPFIPADRNELYFFFTPDVRIPAEKQILDGVTGIYLSPSDGNGFGEAKRIWLQDPGKLALDGAEFIQGNDMWFASAREGYTGIHWFRAVYANGAWNDWMLADFDPAFEVGELHMHGDALYYHSARSGGNGQFDIWMLERIDGEWRNPQNVAAVNSSEQEGWPYITPDGEELWFTRFVNGSPAVLRSVKADGGWQPPELILTQFAGEPTLNSRGDIFFVHHYYVDGRMIEADIYVSRKR